MEILGWHYVVVMLKDFSNVILDSSNREDFDGYVNAERAMQVARGQVRENRLQFKDVKIFALPTYKTPLETLDAPRRKTVMA